jgi:hypothetical protein
LKQVPPLRFNGTPPKSSAVTDHTALRGKDRVVGTGFIQVGNISCGGFGHIDTIASTKTRLRDSLRRYGYHKERNRIA